MVHERDEKYDSQEDGEYHFSDDQANYEVEMDEVDHTVVEKPAKTAAIPAATSRDIAQYKRPLIGVGVFFALVFLVYKITAPTPATAPGDFSQNPGISPAQKVASNKSAPLQMAAAKGASAFQPLAQPLGMSTSTPAGVSTPQPAIAQAPAATVHAPAPLPAPALIPAATTSEPAAQPGFPTPTPAPAVVEQPVPAAQQPAPAVIIQQEPLYNPVHPVNDVNSVSGEVAQATALNQRVANLTQENARLQADYTQKMSEMEAENTALQSKLQDLNTHIANLETTMARLGRTVQQESHTGASTMNHRASAGLMASPAQVMPAASEPKSVYTVQAIIPGRAWLKSENGETVTVAEGDTLRGYGRIVKIDPYDGVVELDIGGRMVSLSYGSTAE